MLQIITGRFFADGPVNEGEFDGILYSNWSCLQPIATQIGELRPSLARGTRLSSYVFRYKVKYETSPDDILILPPGDQAVEQFRVLAGLWFRAFFHYDRQHVELLCRPDPQQAADSGVPSRFVEAFFDAPAAADGKAVSGFGPFLDKVLAMPRATYRLFMSCLIAFSDALEAIDTNRDLAYSMFVYVLEGLTQGSDGFTPTWQDFPQDQRSRLDAQLERVDPGIADAITHILIDNPHLKLMKRFIAFTISHIDDSFFRQEAAGRERALRKNELVQALRSLYKSRSGYVHSLRQIQQHLRLPDWTRNADVFHWDNEPHLTLSGLARLCRHVLLRFVERQPVLEKEEYPAWRQELPGIISAQLAPHLWLGRTDTFRPEFVVKRFNGLVEHLAQSVRQSPITLPDIRSLVELMETLIPNARREHQKVMVCFYWLYHQITSEELHRPKWRACLARYKDVLEECSICMMTSSVMVRGQLSWPVEQCEEAFEDYLNRKFKTRAVNLPGIIEIAVMGEIANLHLESGNSERYQHWMARAILDAAGGVELQEYLQSCKEAQIPPSTKTILGVPSTEQDT